MTNPSHSPRFTSEQVRTRRKVAVAGAGLLMLAGANTVHIPVAHSAKEGVKIAVNIGETAFNAIKPDSTVYSQEELESYPTKPFIIPNNGGSLDAIKAIDPKAMVDEEVRGELVDYLYPQGTIHLKDGGIRFDAGQVVNVPVIPELQVDKPKQ